METFIQLKLFNQNKTTLRHADVLVTDGVKQLRRSIDVVRGGSVWPARQQSSADSDSGPVNRLLAICCVLIAACSRRNESGLWS